MRILKLAVPMVVFGLLLAGLNARAIAEEAKKSGGGKITGTVVDKDGKAVASAKVMLNGPREKGAAKEGDAPAAAKEGDAPSADPKGSLKGLKGVRKLDKQEKRAEKGEKGSKTPPVAETTTDSDGKFTLANVPAGKYALTARVKDVGRAMKAVEVKEGETLEVELKIEPKPAK